MAKFRLRYVILIAFIIGFSNTVNGFSLSDGSDEDWKGINDGVKEEIQGFPDLIDNYEQSQELLDNDDTKGDETFEPFGDETFTDSKPSNNPLSPFFEPIGYENLLTKETSNDKANDQDDNSFEPIKDDEKLDYVNNGDIDDGDIYNPIDSVNDGNLFNLFNDLFNKEDSSDDIINENMKPDNKDDNSEEFYDELNNDEINKNLEVEFDDSIKTLYGLEDEFVSQEKSQNSEENTDLNAIFEETKTLLAQDDKYQSSESDFIADMKVLNTNDEKIIEETNNILEEDENAINDFVQENPNETDKKDTHIDEIDSDLGEDDNKVDLITNIRIPDDYYDVNTIYDDLNEDLDKLGNIIERLSQDSGEINDVQENEHDKNVDSLENVASFLINEEQLAEDHETDFGHDEAYILKLRQDYDDSLTSMDDEINDDNKNTNDEKIDFDAEKNWDTLNNQPEPEQKNGINESTKNSEKQEADVDFENQEAFEVQLPKKSDTISLNNLDKKYVNTNEHSEEGQETSDFDSDKMLKELDKIREQLIASRDDENNDDLQLDDDYTDFYNDEIQKIDMDDTTGDKFVSFGNDALVAEEFEQFEDNRKSSEFDAFGSDNYEQKDSPNEELEELISKYDSEINSTLSDLAVSVEPTTEDDLLVLIKDFQNEYKDLIDTNSVNFDRSVSAIHMEINSDEPIVVTSPDYPDAYPTNNIIDWIFNGEGGAGIEFNLTDLNLDGYRGDYLLVKPGGVDESGSSGLVFTYSLNQARNYKFFDVDKMFVRFHSQSTSNNFFTGFKFSVKFIDAVESTPELQPEPEELVQAPAETLTVFLGGISPHRFHNHSEDFRQLVADMAIMYTNLYQIDQGLKSLNEVTQLTSIQVCNINWPSFETCAAVTFGVPIAYNETDSDEERDYRLNHDDLFTMWTSFIGEDPFAARLERMGISEYAIPDDGRIMVWWTSIALVVLAAVTVLGYILWRWNCFEDYTRMTSMSDSDSIKSSRKSDPNLYPTPHQTLPPLYEDDKYEWDHDSLPKYDDTTRVDMGGAFNNKSFVRDGELLDLESDDEIIMSLPDTLDTKSTRESSIRPRDIYDV